MQRKVLTSLKSINYKLFLSLLVLGACPTIYTTVRVYFLGQLPNEWSFSIAGQLSWINLIYEVISEAIILPLFFFLGQVATDKKELANRLRTGMILGTSIYVVISLLIIIFTKPLLQLMAADPAIIPESITYIRLESVANIFSLLSQFLLVTLITLNRSKYIYILTFARLALSIILDTALVSNLPISLELGINGIAISNIAANIILLLVIIIPLNRENIKLLDRQPLSFAWLKDLAGIGTISGLESFVRNIAYMLMIVRMVNVVNEQGTYWVANNFIWSFLLLPITQLAELIKQDVATDHESVKTRTAGYMALTVIICGVWAATIPLWRPFMSAVLGYGDVDKCYNLVLILLGFYVLYALQNVFDAEFYGLGRTDYMLFESIVTNTIYYGGAFALYQLGLWTPTLTGIALLFGIGMAFDSVVSLCAYIHLRKGMSQ